MSDIKAVILDWAGTTVDFGSRAPMGVFVKVFGDFGVAISIEEARIPMGLPKRAHIKALLDMPRVAEAWRAARGEAPDEASVDAVYAAFVPANAEVAADHADLIPGVAETIQALRTRGIAIGSTTGYTRGIMERILPVAERLGYAPDTLVCDGDTPAGRPSPFMIYRCLLDLAVQPAWACVKVDDTAPGIAEGLAAGCWTVGVSLTGNEVGLTREELEALPAAERAKRNARARNHLLAAGAHYVVDGVADLPACLDAIRGRLARHERP